jgi:glycine cleavage system H protein
MTVVLVVLTLAVLILIDYAQSRKKVMVTEPKTISGSGAIPRGQPEWVCGIRQHGNIRYHPGHTWALRESTTLVRVGIDNLAARMIGRADSILLPKRGQWIRQGQKIFSVFKDGTKTELVSPIEGEVSSVNEAVAKAPILLSSDPYGDGWLLTVISPDAETNFRNLLCGDLARQWMQEEERRLSVKMHAPAALAAHDDGNETGNFSLRASSQSWTELTHEFFLM